MYTLNSIGEDDNGVKFIRSIVRYPATIGYTGEAIKTK